MIRTNELTIGDIVYIDGICVKSQAKITGISEVFIDFVDAIGDGSITNSDIYPIPLTADILEINGFEKTSESPLRDEYRLEIDEENDKYLFVTLYKRLNSARICFQPIVSDVSIFFAKKNCAVHDLQHILRMCGIEKEIVLYKWED